MAAKKSRKKRALAGRAPGKQTGAPHSAGKQPTGTSGGNPPLPASAVAASACCLLLVLYLAIHWDEIGRLFRWLAGR